MPGVGQKRQADESGDNKDKDGHRARDSVHKYIITQRNKTQNSNNKTQKTD
jgi:hypothetical protein